MSLFMIFFIALLVFCLIILWMILDYQYIRMQTLLKHRHSVIERSIDKVRAREI